jgi:diguanylate cyclase (GGDEF)-like protein
MSDKIDAETPLKEAVASEIVQRSLADQLELTSLEIEDRKRLLNITAEDVIAIAAFRREIGLQLDNIVERFYAAQIKVPEIALLIGDAETLERLKHAMRAYVLEMFEGRYDSVYVDKRLRVGRVHQRIGVSPKLFTAALEVLHGLIEDVVEAAPSLSRAEKDHLRRAILKLRTFDLQLVFDTYIAGLLAQVASQRDKLERYALSLEEEVASRTKQLLELSRYDLLTGLANQTAFFEHMRRELSASSRTGRPLSLLFADLNGFKKINDTLGHVAGDQLLAKVAQVIRDSVRLADIPCRYGGDEFCVILPNTRAEEAEHASARIIEAFDRAVSEDVTLSIGIAETEADRAMTTEDLVKLADAAMYSAKKQAYGRLAHALKTPLRSTAVAKLGKIGAHKANVDAEHRDKGNRLTSIKGKDERSAAPAPAAPSAEADMPSSKAIGKR